MSIYHPLTPVFYIPRDSVEESAWKERFLQSFHVTPARFRLNEKKLADGCKKHSVRYIAPQLEDSADETISRKYALHKQIQACKNREWREKMAKKLREEEYKRREEERRQADEKRAEEERKRWATMSPEEKAREETVEKYEEEKKKREEDEMNRSPEEKAQAKQKSIEEWKKQEELRHRWPLMSPEEKAQANQKTAEEERDYREWLRKRKEQTAHDKLKREVLWKKKEYYLKKGMHKEANAAWSQAPAIYWRR
eukprot:scaffold5158_cov79-Skeletonema_dohrnii-CCMP3373.AAC.1